MRTYSFDTSCIIEAWNRYYSPDFCPEYWTVLESLGRNGTVFFTEMVKDEVLKRDDKLSVWLKVNPYFVRRIDETVQKNLRELFAKNADNMRLVDNTKGRSQADPWVIAHAMTENAVVVTKENSSKAFNSKKIKIPDVCLSVNVPWIDDFTFIREVGIKFNCSVSEDI